jgi:hypothetical protein
MLWTAPIWSSFPWCETIIIPMSETPSGFSVIALDLQKRRIRELPGRRKAAIVFELFLEALSEEEGDQMATTISEATLQGLSR